MARWTCAASAGRATGRLLSEKQWRSGARVLDGQAGAQQDPDADHLVDG